MKENQHIVWSEHSVNKVNRQLKNGHKSLIIWLTGLSGSGKTTIANALQRKLFDHGLNIYLLDGDNLRHGINNNLSFTSEGRKENIRRTAEIGKLFVDAGMVVLVSLISPFREDREKARAIFERDEFIEVYVKCTLEECEKRDPKGLYKKVKKGEIQQFTGIDSPYEEPKNPEMILDTNQLSVDECVDALFTYLINNMNLLKVNKGD